MANPNPKTSPGRPKGSKNKVTIEAQLSAIEKRMGMSMEEVMAETLAKLHNDFLQDIHVKEYITFAQHLSNKVTEKMAETTVNIDATKHLSQEEIDEKLKALMGNKEESNSNNTESSTDGE